jgi:hypothetical protein
MAGCWRRMWKGLPRRGSFRRTWKGLPQPTVWVRRSFVWLHECGFNTPASRFMWGLCYHYGVELHNFVKDRYDELERGGVNGSR